LADDVAGCLPLAINMIVAKISNARSVLLRAVRDHGTDAGRQRLEAAARRLANFVDAARQAQSLDQLRGVEGEAAGSYFAVFSDLLTVTEAGFVFSGRSRRPPTDPTNALLSFLYTVLAHDIRSACQAAGLDAAVGFLHRDRPGRPGLALDLMEDFARSLPIVLYCR
jgi:CRISP-associated protein Cas1